MAMRTGLHKTITCLFMVNSFLAGGLVTQGVTVRTIHSPSSSLLTKVTYQSTGWLQHTAPIDLRHHHHRRKAATGSSKIGRLPGIHARGEEQNSPVVGVGANIEFQIRLNAIDFGQAFARRHQRLRDKVPRLDLAPNPAREFVPAVGRLAAVTRHRLEEEAAGVGPQVAWP